MNKDLEDSRNALKEELDKEARRNNIILYRVPESPANCAAERNEQDRKFCEQLLFGLNIGVSTEDIGKVHRLGRKVEDQVRPVLLQFTNQHIKRLVMENLFRLKSLDAKYSSVSISHDMTPAERTACKALVNEARAKEESEGAQGEWSYRVREMPGRLTIVKFPKVK